MLSDVPCNSAAASNQQGGQEDRHAREIRGARKQGVQLEPNAGRDEEDRDEHAVAHGLELLTELRVGHRLVAVDELHDCAGEEGPENRLEAEPVGKYSKENKQEERRADANLRCRVL